jgi:hypothetical protein
MLLRRENSVSGAPVIALVFAARDVEHNHAVVLRNLILGCSKERDAPVSAICVV